MTVEELPESLADYLSRTTRTVVTAEEVTQRFYFYAFRISDIGNMYMAIDASHPKGEKYIRTNLTWWPAERIKF